MAEKRPMRVRRGFGMNLRKHQISTRKINRLPCQFDIDQGSKMVWAPDKVSERNEEFSRSEITNANADKIDIIGHLLSDYGSVTGKNLTRKILSYLDLSSLQQGNCSIIMNTTIEIRY